jgi:glutamate formiminotransferase/formiminotetrahydrofolate cyclodeaminase
MERLISCIPNFSEGIDKKIIDQIVSAISSADGVKLLDVDPGVSTNRTVVTFVGAPEDVIEGAFRGIQKASELIDMQNHRGEHPRMGATDVCPLVPISGVTVQEIVEFAKILAKRVGETLNIPVYLYEYAANHPSRKSLANIRAGEYEGFFEKIKLPEWKPDFGPQEMNAFSGATVIGVRDFLVAYNVNLNTSSVKRANSVAFDIREIGRVKTDEHGKNILDASGEPIRIAGSLKECRAIGWYVEEYGMAQVSINLTNLNVTPLHLAFEECEKSAFKRGLRVTGSEIVGMIPKKCLIDTAKYYLTKQNRSVGLSEPELIQFAIQTLGLNEVSHFDPAKKIIEYAIADKKSDLVSQTVKDFCSILASEKPAPGGGSVAALCGALGAGLGAMVANLSANKKGWDDKTLYFSTFADSFQQLMNRLLTLVDDDTQAYNAVLEAFALPKKSDIEKEKRKIEIEKANQLAASVPLKIMETIYETFPLLMEMVEKGNPNSITDAAVGILTLYTGLMGAGMNVQINLGSIEDKNFKDSTLARCLELITYAEEAKSKTLTLVVFN